MSKVLRYELDRAFRNRRVAAALLIGCGISLWHLWDLVLPVRNYVDSGGYPLSSFNKWMGGENYSFQASLYFMWLPLLCALPHSASFVFDCGTGYGNQAVVRGGRGKYLTAKYIAVFLSGAAVAVLPLVFDFFATNLFLPAVRPQAGTGLSAIGEGAFLGELFYRHPFLYLLCYLLIDGVFYGLFNTLALTAGIFFRNQFAAQLTPFLVYMLLFAVGTTALWFSACPAGFLRPSQLFVPTLPWMMGEMAFLLAAGGVFFRKVAL